MSEKKPKTKYKTTNWAEYNKSLQKRGSLRIVFTDDFEKNWYCNTPKNGRGRPFKYSDSTIKALLTLRYLLNLQYRQLVGFVSSLFERLNLNLDVPDYSQICRRSLKLDLSSLGKLSSKKRKVIVFDATGLKVYGEGEWKVKKHGSEKRRVWKELIISMDPESRDVVDFELTYPGASESEYAEKALRKFSDEEGFLPERVIGDGAYDTLKFSSYCDLHGIECLVPPSKNAALTEEKFVNAEENLSSRDERIKYIREHGLDEWRKTSGYHIRSLVENTFFRYKTIFGQKLFSRHDHNMNVETHLRFSLLNKFNKLGLPKSVPIITN